MRVVFRKRAEADLRRIIAYYDGMSPGAASPVLDDIYRTINLLSDFPRVGMPLDKLPFRRIVTRRFHFKVAYAITGDAVTIIGIFRFEDRER